MKKSLGSWKFLHSPTTRAFKDRYLKTCRKTFRINARYNISKSIQMAMAQYPSAWTTKKPLAKSSPILYVTPVVHISPRRGGLDRCFYSKRSPRREHEAATFHHHKNSSTLRTWGFFQAALVFIGHLCRTSRGAQSRRVQPLVPSKASIIHVKDKLQPIPNEFDFGKHLW